VTFNPATEDLTPLLRDEIGTVLGLNKDQTKNVLGPAFKAFSKELQIAGQKHGMRDLDKTVILEIAKRFVLE
jgi:hypothetical protein